ncbi:MAG TPA: hypothetical protein VLF66_15325, partial [Thermoanaerobaculia bacterium]|nr:hypothetical protein [Thermoanaerobaculia bacterium]
MARHHRRTAAPAAIALLALLLTACFEEPEQDDLVILLRADGRAQVTLTTAFRVDDEDASPALRNRLQGDRRRLLLGEDDWTPRFERLAAASHEKTFEWEKGVLAGVRQTAVVALAEDPEALNRFFSDSLVNALFVAEDGWAELSLYPLAPGRLTRGERQRLDRAIDPWTEVLARYFRASGRLYEYLDERPERAEIAFSVLLEGVLPEEDGGRRAELTAEEEPLVEAVEKAMEAAWEVLLLPESEAHSVNELSRLAYDPFPARTVVGVEGEVTETEGFEAGPEGELAVPTVSFWDALTGLRGVWLEPDPLLLYVARAGGVTGEPGEDLELAAVAAQDRHHAT